MFIASHINQPTSISRLENLLLALNGFARSPAQASRFRCYSAAVGPMGNQRRPRFRDRRLGPAL